MSLPNDLGVRVQLTHFVSTFQRAGVRDGALNLPPSKKRVYERRGDVDIFNKEG